MRVCQPAGHWRTVTTLATLSPWPRLPKPASTLTQAPGDSLPDAPGPLIIVAVRGIQQTVTVIPRLDLFAGVAGGRGERWFRWSGVDRAREDLLGALIPPDRSRTRGLLGEGAAAG